MLPCRGGLSTAEDPRQTRRNGPDPCTAQSRSARSGGGSSRHVPPGSPADADLCVSPSPAQHGFRRPGRPVVPADRHARRDQRDSADKIELALAAEPIEKMEATEATEPIERTDPAEPMLRIEPAEPMDKIDPLDPMLRSEPAEPPVRGEISVFAMPGFSHPCRSAASSCACQRPARAARRGAGGQIGGGEHGRGGLGAHR
jgi:hypothetical protein